MEDAEGCEDCIVVMTKEDGDILYLCTTDKRATKIGLLETAKLFIAAELVKDDG